MSIDARPRVRVPRQAAANEVVNIRTMVTHPMHNGFTVDADGNRIERHIINRFLCTFNGEVVLDMEIEPSLAANPYIEFHARVPESGTFAFTWFDDDGSIYETTSDITVS